MNDLAVLDDNGDPIPCVFQPWLRQIASQRPITVGWGALGLAYDGRMVYLRLLGLGNPNPAKATAASQRSKPRYMVVKVAERWHVLDLRARKRARKRKTIVAVADSRTEAHAIANRLREAHAIANRLRSGTRASRASA